MIRRVAAILALLSSAPALADDSYRVTEAAPVPEVSENHVAFDVDGQEIHIPFYRNVALESSYLFVEHAAILVHGSTRNAAAAYETLLTSAARVGAGRPHTLLVAPQFLTEEDVLLTHGLASAHPFWSASGWKKGNRSLDTPGNPRPVRISSFAVMDSLLARFARVSPNLATLVVAGHSAGGQFVQRYAASSRVARTLRESRGIDVRFVVANPSSYLHFDANRRVPGTGLFRVPGPGTRGSCPDWNRYKYGLEGRNAYLSDRGLIEIRELYRASTISTLLGELDDDPNHPALDTSCAASLQGANRLDRGVTYHDYLRQLFGASILATHRLYVIAGVGHEGRGIFTSDCGLANLFGGAACDPVDAPTVGSSGTSAGGVAAGSAGTGGGPGALQLGGFAPNPFRSSTTVEWRVRGGGSVGLHVFDVHGRRVQSLVDGIRAPASGSAVWDGRSGTGAKLPAGVYFIRLESGSGSRTGRVTVLR